MKPISFEFNTLNLLILVSLVMFVVPNLLNYLLLNGSNEGYNLFLYLFGGLRFDWAVLQLQPWRMVTSNFLHVDLLHIGANMFALFQLGRIIQAYYGGKWLFSFYMITGLFGSLLSLVFLGNAASVGASGAVFGLVGVLITASYRKNPRAIDFPFRLVDILPLVLYSFMFGLIPGVGVNNWAHLGGLLMGLVFGYFIEHKLTVGTPRWVKQLEQYLYYFSVFLFVISYAFMLVSIPLLLNG